jgi:hypothetical protein
MKKLRTSQIDAMSKIQTAIFLERYGILTPEEVEEWYEKYGEVTLKVRLYRGLQNRGLIIED